MNRLGKSLPPLASLLPFEAAARLESFSRAAEELHLTQAAVSRQIRLLEENLATRLFDRRNRAVYLTQEGRELWQVVSSALTGIGNHAEQLRGPTGRHQVVLLAQLCEAFYWLMPRLSTFHQRHPEIEINVVTTTQPLTDFDSHFDVALQSTGRASGASPLVFTAADEVFPVCSPGYLGTHQAISRLEDLAQHTLLHYRTTPAHQMEWENWLAVFGMTLSSHTQASNFNSYPMMLQAAVEGHGIALGWRRTAGKLIDSGALVRPCVESVPLPQAISVYTRSALAERAETAALLHWLQQEMLSE
ncbi:LysR substrate-binding domain-containing protein [Serratia sp. OS31]|uniref:LysR substrate-binding domain-containing protein n=1 Tax=Serratia sp. OS31 TaxID=2760844 RepID=UPI001601C587|nr:LysR substrate-binding domain-containing protein [Serratia sp. OS31]MBB1581734.1 LysR family transcriptional regulator [Serratia sp. OS31]